MDTPEESARHEEVAPKERHHESLGQFTPLSSPRHHLEDLSEYTQREEILKSLEEDFRRGLREVALARGTQPTAEQVEERIFSEVFLLRRGSGRWEGVRSAYIHSQPVITSGAEGFYPTERGLAFRVYLKEVIVYFNVCRSYLITLSEKGSLKIYGIGKECLLDKRWESSNSLFLFLFRSKSFTSSVADVLTTTLLLLYSKHIKEIEKVFEEFVIFSKASSATRAFFCNGYICFVYSFGDMGVFDESLREIPLGINSTQILSSILKEDSSFSERQNFLIRKEVTIHLDLVTIKVSPYRVKLIYAKKTIYEEIPFKKIDQAIYTEGCLFLREKSFIHIITLKE
ncbi:hypothetical protein NEDG_00706 [Nematocida displodere]|uniref:Uncharacterized protein n=1 Tax=Nematocida displodere TaxID=1805483 RepID=A0A177EC90_9MICR|nr:hypothetical protein NEDG_00706 [Nematocida displodere]